MTQLSRIAYVMETPLNVRDYRRYGMADMVARGMAVDVIEATALINPLLNETAADMSETPGVNRHIVASRQDLRQTQNILGLVDFVILILNHTGDPGATAVYRTVSATDTPYLVIASNAYPGFLRHRDSCAVETVKNIADRLKTGTLNPLRSILGRLPARWLGLRAPALIVHGGQESHKAAYRFPVDESTRVVNAHAMDYELFRSFRDTHQTQTDTAVFIDEHMGFQRDMIAQGADMPDQPESFYPKLREFFDRVERETGLEVVIAADPRADYSDKPGLFGDRRIVYRETARLVAESKLVLAHRSTALGFAFMFRRPVMLIATRRMYKHWAQKPAMDAFAKLLGKTIEFFDNADEADLSHAFDMNTACYDTYNRDYIKIPGSTDHPYWDIVISAMQDYLAAAPNNPSQTDDRSHAA